MNTIYPKTHAISIVLKSQQDTFTKIVTHLRAQGGKAKKDGDCKYRGENGRSCAAGCLIPDNEYGGFPMERLSVFDIFSKSPDNVVRVIHEMQSVHDAYDPSSWEHRFTIVALEYQLTVPAL